LLPQHPRSHVLRLPERLHARGRHPGGGGRQRERSARAGRRRRSARQCAGGPDSRRAATPRPRARGAGARARAVLRRGHRAALRSALPPVVPVTAHARARRSVTLTRSERCGINLAGRRPMKTLIYACVVFFAVVAAAAPSLLWAQTPAAGLAK